MKRIIFFIFVLIMLTSCQKKREFDQSDINLDFKSEAQIYIGDKFEIKSDIIVNKNQTLNIVVKEPSNLEGLTISCSGDQYNVSYKDLSLQNSEQILPKSSFFYGMYEIFKEIGKRELKTVSNNDKEVVFSGNSTCGEFVICVDKTDDKISKMELKNTNIVINFK